MIPPDHNSRAPTDASTLYIVRAHEEYGHTEMLGIFSDFDEVVRKVTESGYHFEDIREVRKYGTMNWYTKEIVRPVTGKTIIYLSIVRQKVNVLDKYSADFSVEECADCIPDCEYRKEYGDHSCKCARIEPAKYCSYCGDEYASNLADTLRKGDG